MLQYIGTLLLIMFLCIPVGVIALWNILDGFRVGSTEVDITAHNICKRVYANDGQEYFVATKTSSEWNEFLANTPSGVQVEDCTWTVCNITSLSSEDNFSNIDWQPMWWSAGSFWFSAATDVFWDTMVSGIYTLQAYTPWSYRPSWFYVFERNNWNWNQTQKVIEPWASPSFGEMGLVTNRNFIVVWDSNRSRWGVSWGPGRVYIYTKVSWSWILKKSFLSPGSSSNDLFGMRLALQWSTLVVSSNDNVYVYDMNSGNPILKQTLNAPSTIYGNPLWQRVSIDWNQLLVWNDVYTKVSNNWVKTVTLLPSNYSHRMISGDISGDRIIMNASMAFYGTSTHYIYIYEKENGNWIEKERILISGIFGTDAFIDGKYIVADASVIYEKIWSSWVKIKDLSFQASHAVMTDGTIVFKKAFTAWDMITYTYDCPSNP